MVAATTCRTVMDAVSATPPVVATIKATPATRETTLPEASTDATSGFLLDQVIVGSLMVVPSAATTVASS